MLIVILSFGVCSGYWTVLYTGTLTLSPSSSRKLPEGVLLLTADSCLFWGSLITYFLGNGRVAKLVATAAAKHLTPITLELGGVASLIDYFLLIPSLLDLKANLRWSSIRHAIWRQRLRGFYGAKSLMLVKHVLHLIMYWCPRTSRISLSGLLRRRASSLFASFACICFLSIPLACIRLWIGVHRAGTFYAIAFSIRI